jgi:hypothetical protein
MSSTIQHFRSSRPMPPPLEYDCVRRDEPRSGSCIRSDCATAPLPPELSGPEHSPHDQPTPESLLPRYSPIPSLPPAKQTRKAMKRRCEAELLRNKGEEDTLLLSPLHDSPPLPALSPLSMPITFSILRTPPLLSPPGKRPIYANSSHPEAPFANCRANRPLHTTADCSCFAIRA